jgi:hypothetical protein
MVEILTDNRADGGASMTQPVKGFADPSISRMFDPPMETSTANELESKNSPAVSHPDRQRERNIIIGAITGVVVGCVIITAIAIYILQKRRKAKNALKLKRDEDLYFPSKELTADSQPTSPQEMMAEMAYIKELESEYPAQELAGAEVRAEVGTKEDELVELESPGEVTRKWALTTPVSPVKNVD